MQANAVKYNKAFWQIHPKKSNLLEARACKFIQIKAICLRPEVANHPNINNLLEDRGLQIIQIKESY